MGWSVVAGVVDEIVVVGNGEEVVVVEMDVAAVDSNHHPSLSHSRPHLLMSNQA